VIDIVHGGPAHSSIIPREPHWLDKVDSRPQTGTEAQNGADVSGDFRLEKSNAHYETWVERHEPWLLPLGVPQYEGNREAPFPLRTAA
jgi:hypothetical protein